MDELFYYNNIKYKIIKHLRGDYSQLELSQKMGYQFNQVYKWEAGNKSMNLFDFMDFCDVFGLSIENIFTDVFILDFKGVPEEEFFTKLHARLGPKSKDQLTELLGVNKSTLYRWFKGNGTPDLALIFYWIDKTTQYFPDLIAQITGKKVAMELLDKNTPIVERRVKYAKYPYLAAVEYFLVLNKYTAQATHSNKFIADELSLTEQEVEIAINELIRCNCIYESDGKYLINFLRTDLGTIDLEASAKMGKYWSQKCLNRFSTPNGVPRNSGGPDNIWGYRVLPVPRKLDSTIKEKISLCIQDIIKLVESSEHDSDEIKCLVFHMFNVQDS